MELPDGRELAWLEVGKPRGNPVFMFHGTPGSRLQVTYDEKTIAASGVRLVAPDRPGYGHSSFHPGRTLADWASDVAALADHLKLERFAVAGVSGGGPHAAACARLLPERVTVAGIVSGVGPMAEPGLDRGMAGFNRGLKTIGERAPFALIPIFAVQDYFVRHWPEAALRAVAKRVPESDARLLQRPEVRKIFIDDAARAPATAAHAAAQDFQLFARDWGFRVADIAVPVHVWHGDADKNVPFAHGQYVADQIAGAQFHACLGEGHFLVIERLGEILRTLSAGS
jgi:pimeloyl-ACP methyl ester carboxylesterase